MGNCNSLERPRRRTLGDWNYWVTRWVLHKYIHSEAGLEEHCRLSWDIDEDPPVHNRYFPVLVGVLSTPSQVLGFLGCEELFNFVVVTSDVDSILFALKPVPSSIEHNNNALLPVHDTIDSNDTILSVFMEDVDSTQSESLETLSERYRISYESLHCFSNFILSIVPVQSSMFIHVPPSWLRPLRSHEHHRYPSCADVYREPSLDRGPSVWVLPPTPKLVSCVAMLSTYHLIIFVDCPSVLTSNLVVRPC
mmetsp:Transcript_10643/g.21428  ORF Transcript_10643/g.21428 Transcript_10643/m.21428 type:complete len:250 (-) Transcript_10643:1745-2494(-)